MTTAPSEPTLKRRLLPWLVASVAVVLLIVAGLVSHYWYSAHELIGAFGMGTSSMAQSETYKKYFTDARQALEAWLPKQGFQSTPVLNARGDVRYGAIYEAWYVGSHQGSRPFLVKLELGGQNQVGLGASVDWDYRGLKWTMPQDRDRARAFGGLLKQWWNDYTRDHPIP